MDLWIAFVFASLIILVIPGPTIILVMSHSITYGHRSVVPLVSGVIVGDLVAMTCSLLGLGALLSTSYLLFSLFKGIGAVYLLYLGIKMWMQKADQLVVSKSSSPERSNSFFRGAFIVTALNPKSIAFFVAFFPQFIDYTKPVASQLFFLGATFLFLAGVNATLYALFAGSFRTIIGRLSVRRWINRAGGTALIGAGIFTAVLKRN